MAEAQNKKRKLVNTVSEPENDKSEPEISQKLKKVKISGKKNQTSTAASSTFHMILRRNKESSNVKEEDREIENTTPKQVLMKKMVQKPPSCGPAKTKDKNEEYKLTEQDTEGKERKAKKVVNGQSQKRDRQAPADNDKEIKMRKDQVVTPALGKDKIQDLKVGEKDASQGQITSIASTSNSKTLAEQADEIINIIFDSEKFKDFYTLDFSENPLAQRLFFTGIDPNELTPNPVQKGFRLKSKLVFYPTWTTHKIFRIVLTNMFVKLLCYSSKGIGKSYSLALLVYLLRQKADTRVLFLHNLEDFVATPMSYFMKELKMAFPGELKELKISNSQLQKKEALPANSDPSHEIIQILAEVYRKLDSQNIALYIIWDQINCLNNLKDSRRSQDEFAWSLFSVVRRPIGVNRFTVAMMSSSGDQIISNLINQEILHMQIQWQNPMEEQIKRFIQNTFSLNLKNEEDKLQYEKLFHFSEGYFLMIAEFAEYKKDRKGRLEELLGSFKEHKINSLVNEARKFLTSIKAKKRARENTMKRVLASISNDEAYTIMFYPDDYDKRYFVEVYEFQSGIISFKMLPLHSLIVTAYQQVLPSLKS